MIPIKDYIPSAFINDVVILNKLRNQQHQKLVKAQTAGTPMHQEIQDTKYMFEKNNCETYIDIGAWLGVIPFSVYKNVRPKKMIVVDAIPTYLKIAKDHLFVDETYDNVFVEEICILGRKNVETWKSYFVVDIDNTIDTSCVTVDENSKCLVNKNTIRIPTARAETASKMPAMFLDDINNSRCFLKTDIDGNDHYFWKEILASGLRPTVIKFEMFTWDSAQEQLTEELLKIVRDAGYATPCTKDWKVEKCALSTFTLSKDYWSVSNCSWITPGNTWQLPYHSTVNNY